MANIITIPQRITNGKELLVVSKEDWERLLEIAKMKISQMELEKGLREAIEDVKKGRFIGPFSTAKEAIKALKDARPK